MLAENIKKKFTVDLFSGKCQSSASVEQLKLSRHLTHSVNKVGNSARTVSSVVCLYVFFKGIQVKKEGIRGREANFTGTT